MSSGRYGIEANYDDIINLPHHVSRKRPHMSLHDRAAQFAPFAALTGYGEAIDETGRLTSEKRLLSESEKTALDDKLRMLANEIENQPEISVIYFLPDLLKEGGCYQEVKGRLKRIHEYRRMLILQGGIEIPLADILEIDSQIFCRYE